MTLSDNSTTISELQERLSGIQRALAGSEQDRRVLTERLDTTRSVHGNEKRFSNQNQSNQNMFIAEERTNIKNNTIENGKDNLQRTIPRS